MYATDLFADLGNATVLVLSLSALRVSIAFFMLPLFSKDGVPALVRNSMFLSLALVSVLIQPAADVGAFDTGLWIALFAKEAFIGMVVGLFLGIFLWAFEAAGVVIDMQIGASFALYFDPIVGNEVTLIGSFLGRWANYLFVAAGGLLLLTGALLESFAIWPLVEPLIGSLREASVRLFENGALALHEPDHPHRRPGHGGDLRHRRRDGADQPLRAAVQRLLPVDVA